MMEDHKRRDMNIEDYYTWSSMTSFCLFVAFDALVVLVGFPIVGIYIPKWLAIILGVLIYITQYLAIAAANTSSFHKKILSTNYDSWKLSDNTYVYLFNSDYLDVMNKHSYEIGGSYFLKKDSCYIINSQGEMLMTDTEVPVLMVFDSSKVASAYIKEHKEDLDDGNYLVVPLRLKNIKSLEGDNND